VSKVLAHFVTVVRGGQREFFQLKYEKFPKFYGACGFLGHSHLECGSGEHNEDDLKWGIGSKLIGQHGMVVVLRLIGVVVVLVEAERRLAWEEAEVLEVQVSLRLAGDLMISQLYVCLMRGE
jgi:hypothetical protein